MAVDDQCCELTALHAAEGPVLEKVLAWVLMLAYGVCHVRRKPRCPILRNR